MKLRTYFHVLFNIFPLTLNDQFFLEPVSTLFFLFLLTHRNSLYILYTKCLLVLGVTNVLFKLMDVKNCKGSETAPYLQAHMSAYHNVTGAEDDKRLLNKREETITHSKANSMSISIIVSTPLTLKF